MKIKTNPKKRAIGKLILYHEKCDNKINQDKEYREKILCIIKLHVGKFFQKQKRFRDSIRAIVVI